MPEGLPDRIAALIGSRVLRTEPLQGGSLSSVLRVALEDGRTVVVKQAAGATREARMLARMAAAGAPVPHLLGHKDDLLVMEDVGPAGTLTSGDAVGWAALADALHPLHAAVGDRYGWPEDHAFGAVEIINSSADNWPDFWALRRLTGPAAGLPAALRHRLDRLACRLTDFIPPAPPPTLLHGDLWGGNVLLPAPARAILIDPACYYGDRRVDLAMLSFFARPPQAFLETTGTAEAEWPQTCAVYQLWPALVHLRLFGGHYLDSVVQRLVALGV